MCVASARLYIPELNWWFSQHVSWWARYLRDLAHQDTCCIFARITLGFTLRLIVDKFYGKNAPEDIGEMTTMPGLSMNASTYPPPSTSLSGNIANCFVIGFYMYPGLSSL